MKTRLIAFGLLFLFLSAVNATAKDKENTSPPVMVYHLHSTCGDFLRADAGQYNLHFAWVSGLISGMNFSLPKGGNVLGGGEKKVEDFMMLVKKSCEEDPTNDFVSAAMISLKKMQPVDWKGQPVKSSK